MNLPALDPAIEHCLMHYGIVLNDPEQGWITVCEVVSQGLGYIYFMQDQFDHPEIGASPDLVVASSGLRARIASAIAQGCPLYLG